MKLSIVYPQLFIQRLFIQQLIASFLDHNLSTIKKSLLMLCLILFVPITAQATCIATDSGAPYNTITGCNAMEDKTTAEDNTATGFKALQHTTTGSWNTAVGNLAMQYNTTGSRNTGVGPEALLNNTTGNNNTAIGFLALGNSKTASDNTAIGTQTLYMNSTGHDNTASGVQALFSNTTGYFNTATGVEAMYGNVTGYYNTAVGYRALTNNTGPTETYSKGGTSNTAFGYQTLAANITGWQNTAIGESVLTSNTIGAHNTGIGEDSLFGNLSGNHNTAWGESTLYQNTSGSDNVAGGYYALNTTTGSGNTAIGHQASMNLVAGDYNPAIGYQSGLGLTSGSHNIYVASAGASNESYIIRMGTQGKHLRTYIAGISGVTATNGAAVYINSNGQLGTLPSSQRFKKDIQSLDATSEKIMALRPVTFRYKQADEKGDYPIQFGLIAEEVAKIFPELVQFDEQSKPLSVFYQLLTPLLLAELQRGHIETQTQQTALNLLLEQNALFKAELLAMSQQIKSQAAQIALLNHSSPALTQQLAH